MPDGQGPATGRRRLRAELRELRLKRNLTPAEVARELDWSLSKVTRIEKGDVGISITDTRALLNVYQVSPAAAEDLVNMARRARERRWWSQYGEVLSKDYREFIALEAEAVRLRHMHPTIVPGLLQTEAYIRALVPALSLTPPLQRELDGVVTVRLLRQRGIVDENGASEYSVCIDEGALHRIVGGRAVMREQLLHLAAVQSRPNVSVAILPYAAGPHLGMQGAFAIMEFAGEGDEDVLYLETAERDVALRDQPDLLARYRRHFDEIVARSLTGDHAVDFVRKLAAELG